MNFVLLITEPRIRDRCYTETGPITDWIHNTVHILSPPKQFLAEVYCGKQNFSYNIHQFLFGNEFWNNVTVGTVTANWDRTPVDDSGLSENDNSSTNNICSFAW